MRFTTESGAKYDIFEVSGVKYITRDCEIPVVDLVTGDAMSEIAATRVWYERPPMVGERFFYETVSHAGCVSTPVVSIDEEQSDGSA